MKTVTLSQSGSLADRLSPQGTYQDDPTQDGWSSEVFSQQAQTALNEIFASLVTKEESGEDVLRRHLTSTFRSTGLQPPSTEVVYRDDGCRIVRGELPEAEWSVQGVAEFQRALDQLRTASGEATARHKKIKIVRTTFGTQLETDVLLSLIAHDDKETVQLHLEVTCGWEQQAGDPPRLGWCQLETYEEARLESETGTWFREYAPSVMREVPAYEAQLGHNCDHWAQRIEARLGANFMGYHGVSVGDVNGDLLDDVYLCQPGGTPNLLLVQQPDGTLRDQSAAAGVDWLDSSRAALWLDLDGDGDQDLALTTITGLLLLENMGNVQFEVRQRFAQARLGYSLCAADYDRDGDLDLYVCRYHAPADAEVGHPLPYFDANNGSPNVLIQNQGNWQFGDVTDSVGLDADNTRWSYAASWADYDRDGDPDLYVANDFGRNCLYRNDDGQFINVAPTAGVEDIASGMSVTWGDYNHDGLPDLYVSNMFSSAGGRITFQRQFKDDFDNEAQANLQRLARGNSLFENQGDGSFRDVTLDAGVAMGRWAWGSLFADINNDGQQDILVANGNYTGEDTRDL